MKKHSFIGTIIKFVVMLVITHWVVGCAQYDDSYLMGKYSALEHRVAALEALCKNLNKDVSSLQEVISALESRDYVKEVEKIYDRGELIGYALVMSSGDILSIYNGKDGLDGDDGTDGKDAVLDIQISVRKGADGIWYWTLNGDWMTDEDGNKVVAVGRDGKDGKDGEDGADGKDGQDGKDGVDGADGKDGEDGQDGKDGADGKDGITPQFRIVNDFWEVSYDNGQTWVSLGKAVGDDGQDGEGATSVFKDLDDSHIDYVILTLYDGTSIKLPKYRQFSFNIDVADGLGMSNGSVREIPYSISGASEKVQIETISEGIKAKIISTDKYNGYVQVTADDKFEEDAKVLIFVVDNGVTIMRKLTFEDCVLQVEDGTAHEVSYLGGEVQLNVLTNTDVEVIIPEDAASWVSLSVDTKSVQRIGKTIIVKENKSVARAVSLTIKDKYSNYCADFTIFQQEDPYSYVSTDFSKNGTWITLQEATAGGTGLNVVFMGDAYTDRLIADGTYDRDMRRAMEHFFEVEPYASLRDMFNCYQVYAVSKNGAYATDASTAFDCQFGEGSLITGYDDKVFMYAQKVDEIKNGKWGATWSTEIEGEMFTYYPDVIGELVVVVVLNSTNYAGTCYMYSDGNAIAYCALHSSEQDFAEAIHHEVGGHAFGRLADEYDGSYSVLTEQRRELLEAMKSVGCYKNVDTTGDSQNVIWSYFISDDRYMSEVGVFEGAYLCNTGVWRPSVNSIMRYNTGGYNAPSREAIYRRAMEINKGASYTYSFEDFASFDADYRNELAITKSVPSNIRDSFVPYAEPRIIEVRNK